MPEPNDKLPAALPIADLLDPAEIRAAQQAARALIRAALGDQYPLWSKIRKKDQTNERH